MSSTHQSLRASFAALRHRNFTLLWIGLFLSRIGTWMQTAALLWHVSLLAPDAGISKELALGMVGLVRVVPILLFSLVGGALADSVSRRKVMLVTMSGFSLVSISLAYLTLNNSIVVWHIYALTGLNAIMSVFDIPARQSLMPNLVPREDFPNAVSLMTITGQASAVLGPTIGGLVIAWLNIGAVYIIDFISYGAVLLALLLMRNVRDVQAGSGSRITFSGIRDGWRFVFSNQLISSTMVLDFFATFFSSARALLPIFAQEVLHVGPQGYGLLSSAESVGSVIASVMMVTLAHRINRRGWTVIWSVVAYGLATVVFGLSTFFWLTFVSLSLIGASDTVSMIIRNIIRLQTTPDAMRGRMTGINMIFFMGGPQLGEAEAGFLASAIGAPLSVVVGGIGCLLATGVTALRAPALRAYRKDDTLPGPVE